MVNRRAWRRRTAILLAGVALASAFTFGAPGGSDTATGVAKPGASSEPVSIDLIVRDKHGGVVRDLQPGEVQIEDDGKPVEIKSLRLTTSAAAAQTERREAEASARIHLVTLVFDNSNPAADELASEIVSETLKLIGPAHVYFSVWQIQNAVGLVREFTNDEAALKRAIMPDPKASKRKKSAQAQDQTSPAAAVGHDAPKDVQRELTTAEAKILSDSGHMIREQHMKPSVAALLAMARDEKPLPGRKSVLYFSDGLTISTANQEQMQAIIGSANRSRVSIYPVNTNGISDKALDDAQQMVMMTPGIGGSSMVSHAGGNVGTGGAGSTVAAAQKANSLGMTNGTGDFLEKQNHLAQATRMKDLAAETGGMYLDGTGPVRKSIQRIGQDLTTYYEATYIPPKEDFDGHFRSLEVKVDRPHVRVQSRSGYFALPPYEGDDLAPFELPMLKALTSAQKVETFWFDSAVFRMESREDRGRANLLVQVPLSGLVARENDNTKLFRLHLALLALVKDRDGRTVEKLSQDLALEGALEQLGMARKDSYTFSRAFSVGPGDYHVDMAVADQNANKLSAKTIAFSIPSRQTGLELSSLLVVRQVEHESSEVKTEDLLRYKDSRIIPDINSRAARIADPAHPVFFEIFPDPKAVTLPEVELELMRGETLVAKRAIAVSDAAPGEPIPVLASFPQKDLAAGVYSLRATVRQSATSHEEQVSFELSGAARAESAEAYLKEQDNPETASFDQFAAKPKLLANATKPTAEQIDVLLKGARERAIDYNSQLPNFLCMQATQRFIDPTGKGSWKAKDSFTTLLRYVDGKENASLVEVEGRRAKPEDDTAATGTIVTGEFGELLGMIFAEKAKSKIEWLGVAEISGARTQVFRFSVSREHSVYQVIAGQQGSAIDAAYQALVYVDTNTFGVRRLTIEAQDVPKNFPVRESAITVEYDYVPISGNDYLLPLRASLFVRQGPHYLRRNEIQFQAYRKYGAESTLKSKR